MALQKTVVTPVLNALELPQSCARPLINPSQVNYIPGSLDHLHCCWCLQTWPARLHHCQVPQLLWGSPPTSQPLRGRMGPPQGCQGRLGPTGRQAGWWNGRPLRPWQGWGSSGADLCANMKVTTKATHSPATRPKIYHTFRKLSFLNLLWLPDSIWLYKCWSKWTHCQLDPWKQTLQNF